MTIFYAILGVAFVGTGAFYIRRAWQIPQLHRAWERHHAQLPHATFLDDGDIEVNNIRHARYREEFDFDLSYTNELFDPRDVVRVWYTLAPWGPLSIQAHAWLTFDFSDGRSLAVAAEVRKTHAFSFTVTDVLAGNYEIFYVVADEQDMLYLRTHLWKNETRMYPLKLDPLQMQRVFTQLAHRLNVYAEKPMWYRVTYRQCNTEPMYVLRSAGLPLPRWHYAYIIAGWCDWLLHKKGLIDTHKKFPAAQKQFTLDLDVVAAVPLDEHFSQNIRKAIQ
jgi:hypothetical protein